MFSIPSNIQPPPPTTTVTSTKLTVAAPHFTINSSVTLSSLSSITGTNLHSRSTNFRRNNHHSHDGTLKITNIDAAQQYDYETKLAKINDSYTKLKIGVVGFGNYGQFLAKTLVSQGHTVLAHSRSDYSQIASKLGVSYFTNPHDLCEEHPELLLDFSSPCGKQELIKLRDVLSSWGCFQLVNHGITGSLMDQIHFVGKEFFALPVEEKLKYSRTVDWIEGYGCDTVSEDQPINWNDRMHLRIHPVEKRNLKLWPDIVPNFRETLDEYSIGMKSVLELVLKAIARSLDLEENTLYDQFEDDGTMFARFNFYPPCPEPDRVCGIKPHSDGSLFTILLQDKEVEGLQVLKDDQWYNVPVIPDALFINVGDQLEIVSNGILKSPVHRVVIDKEKARMSLAVPGSMHLDKELGPLSELIDEDRPRLYKNVSNYLTTFVEHYARGERAIDTMKIQH